MRVKDFPPDVVQETSGLQLKDELFKNRKQVRGVTIDGYYSRDLDDAVWLQTIGSGYLLSVSIADVDSLVKPNSFTDQEAFRRSFTRYYATHNDPMVPRALSEGRLSLLEGELRPTLTVDIPLSADGKPASPDVYESYLKSDMKISYSRADRMSEEPTDLGQMLSQMDKLSKILFQNRLATGAIGFYNFRRGLISNEDGKITNIKEGDAFNSHIIIQEFMILANSVIADFAVERKVPIMFRNHKASKNAPNRAELSDQIEGFIQHPEQQDSESFVRRLGVIMHRANYDASPEGHYALNLSAYTHFTSPIRRYPDLVTHRNIKALLAGDEPPYSADELTQIAAKVNQAENEIKDLGKEDQLKLQRYRIATQAVGSGRFHHLDDKDLHRALSITLASGEMHQNLEPNLEVKIRNGKLPSTDIYLILLETPLDDQRWNPLKKLSVDWLRKQPHESISFLKMASDRLGWTDTTFQTQRIGSDSSHSFYSSANIEVNGVQYSSKVCRGKTIKEAQQLASTDLITRIVNISIDNTEPLPPVAPKPKVIKRPGAFTNHKGLLNELHTRGSISTPIIEIKTSGSDHAPIFEAVASTTINGTAYGTEPIVGSSKREAEQKASEKLLQIIESIIPVEKAFTKKSESKAVTSPNAKTAEVRGRIAKEMNLVEVKKNDYIGALNGYYQTSGVQPFEFTFTSTGPANNLTFVCRYEYVDPKSGQTTVFEGEGKNKSESRQKAAGRLYSHIVTVTN